LDVESVSYNGFQPEYFAGWWLNRDKNTIFADSNTTRAFEVDTVKENFDVTLDPTVNSDTEANRCHSH
jgi:hypothetical protein